MVGTTKTHIHRWCWLYSPGNVDTGASVTRTITSNLDLSSLWCIFSLRKNIFMVLHTQITIYDINHMVIICIIYLHTMPYDTGYLRKDQIYFWVDLCENLESSFMCLGQFLNWFRPRQKSRFFTDDTFKCIFLNENIRIEARNSLKFVPKGLINKIPALVLIMAWRRPGDKPLSEPMLVRSLTHICVTRPQWDKLCLAYVPNCLMYLSKDRQIYSKKTFLWAKKYQTWLPQFMASTSTCKSNTCNVGM